MKEKCTRCGNEASYLDINQQSWVCKECYDKECKNIDLNQYRKNAGEENFQGELDKILNAVTKLFDTVNQSKVYEMEKRFEKTPYTKDINKLLTATTKDELLKISEALEIKKMYKLKKKEVVEVILSNYEEKLLNKFQLLDENSYKMLKKFAKDKGEISVDKINIENENFIDYLLDIGVMFTTKNNEDIPIFIIPTVTESVIKELDEFKYRLRIKENTKIVKLYTGMIRAYGLLEEARIIKFIRKYIEEDNKHLLDVLRESSKYNLDYEIRENFIYSSKIGNCMNLFNDINKFSKEIDYIDFSEEELIALSKENWEVDNKYAREFKGTFLRYFDMDEEEADEFLEFLYAIVQEKPLEDILEEINHMIQEDEAKEIGVELIKNYIINIPIWLKKGRIIGEVR